MFTIQILITSNDSRIRLYNLKTHTLDCKYKGFTNSSSQIKGSFRYVAPSILEILCCKNFLFCKHSKSWINLKISSENLENN